MIRQMTRRNFLSQLGLSATAANLAWNLPSFGWANSTPRGPKKRLVFVFTPNGVIPKHFWPEKIGTEFELPRILEPLTEFKSRMMTLHGICNKIRGDGDGHMRGIGCLLTGVELFPGDIQGGSHTPAGWSQGISIDQHLKNKLQADPATQTRFGSLEFGVMVPDRADTWTRWSYAGANQPVAPIDNPYKMFNKLYGESKNKKLLASVLDDLATDFQEIESMVSSEDRHLLRDHLAIIRGVEKELAIQLAQKEEQADVGHAVPEISANVEEVNNNMPQITRMQMDLLVSSFVADFTLPNHQECWAAAYELARNRGRPPPAVP